MIMMMMSRVMSCVVEGGNVPTIHMHMGIVGLVRCTIVPPPIRVRLSAEVVHYLIVRTETSSVGICLAPRGYMGVVWWWPRNLPALSF